MNLNRLPQTDSIKELAQFWQTHDVTEFDDELEEVPALVFDREEAVTVHLTYHDAAILKKIARAKGVNDSELIREWVIEKVHGP